VLTRTQKEEQGAELNEKFSRAKSVYVADYRGLDVAAANNLRQRIRKGGAGDFETGLRRIRFCGARRQVWTWRVSPSTSRD